MIMKYIKTHDCFWIRTGHIQKLFIEEIPMRKHFEVRIVSLGHLYVLKQYATRQEAEEYCSKLVLELE
jgi:hypothetical protein